MSTKRNIFCCLCLCIFGVVNAYTQSAEATLQEANQLYEQNDYAPAQEKYLQALKQAEAENNPVAMARTSLSLMRCYYYLHDRTAAYKTTYNALHLIQKYRIDSDSLLSRTYYILGALYIEDRMIDSAQKYSFKAIELMQKENDYKHLSQTYSTLATLYHNEVSHKRNTIYREKIEVMIDSAEKYAELSQDKSMMAFAATKRFNYCFF